MKTNKLNDRGAIAHSKKGRARHDETTLGTCDILPFGNHTRTESVQHMRVEFQLFWHVKYKLKSTVICVSCCEWCDILDLFLTQRFCRECEKREIETLMIYTWKERARTLTRLFAHYYFLHLIIIIHRKCFLSLNWTNPHACSRHNLLLWRNIQWIKKYNKKEKLNRDDPTRHPTRHEQCEMRAQRIEHDKISRCD